MPDGWARTIISLCLVACSCDSTLPSERLRANVQLPVPSAAYDVAPSTRFTRTDEQARQHFSLSPRTLIPIAFARAPAIKSSLSRFRSEEARYDFFYTSRDSLTPQLRTSNRFGESRTAEETIRHRNHTVELGLEKRFFDTTELEIGVGYEVGGDDQALGYRPFVTASIRYPLWVSRQKLERTSEEIFRRNEVNDAQLAYIQLVRRWLLDALSRFYMVVDLRRRVEHLERWVADLQRLMPRLDEIAGRDVSKDRERIHADMARIEAEIRERQGRYDVDLERLKSFCGLPFGATLEIIDEPFNPFEELSHIDLFRLSVRTDPDIATLRNAERNAQVQLDLARRGRWDLALLMDGQADLEGGGELDGASDWSFSVGVDISVVDKRVTDSLIRQSQANIARFTQAIARRENEIYVETFEPMIRIETLTLSRNERLANLPRYVTDYARGVTTYMDGELNIDDLLKRRETLFDEQEAISRLTFILGRNVAELCAATGKFFELLHADGEPPPDGD